MIGSRQVSAQELVNLLQEWIASGAFLSVQAQLLSVDMECAVAITSFGEPECRTTEETSSSLETSISIVLGVLLILVLSIAIVVVIIVVVLMRRSKNAKVDLPAVTSQE